MIYILGLGSNDGDRELHLQNALNMLALNCDFIYSSTHYASPAIGDGKKFYLNSVAMVDFNGATSDLEHMLKQFEISEGRTPEARAQGRVPLDIDIVIADNIVIRPSDFARYFFRRGYEELLSALGPTSPCPKIELNDRQV